MQTILAVLTSSRFKSFYWRTAMMALAGFVALLADNIGAFEFSPQVTVVLGLIAGELSKYLNSKKPQ